jgi:hypothetical protein
MTTKVLAASPAPGKKQLSFVPPYHPGRAQAAFLARRCQDNLGRIALLTTDGQLLMHLFSPDLLAGTLEELSLIGRRLRRLQQRLEETAAREHEAAGRTTR